MWRYLRQCPKWLAAFAIIAGSVAVLIVWQMKRAAREAAARVRPAQIEDT